MGSPETCPVCGRPRPAEADEKSFAEACYTALKKRREGGVWVPPPRPWCNQERDVACLAVAYERERARADKYEEALRRVDRLCMYVGDKAQDEIVRAVRAALPPAGSSPSEPRPDLAAAAVKEARREALEEAVRAISAQSDRPSTPMGRYRAGMEDAAEVVRRLAEEEK